MSGESTSRSITAPEAMERAFGPTAVCNRCGEQTGDYRVVAHFLHDTAVVRAYCRACYPRVEGEYHASGDGLLLTYDEFARRFGAPGPPPPVATRVDRLLARLLGSPEVMRLVPPSEALAKRRRALPYTFDLGVRVGDDVRAVMLALEPDGSVASLQGEPVACERVRGLIAGV
jgi:hypothetical protein